MRNSVFLIFILSLIVAIGACRKNSETGIEEVKSEPQNEQLKRDEPIKVGETAPDFSLTKTDGEEITLSEIKKPAMLVFYRGHW